MIQPIRTFLAVFIVAARRLWSTRWLALAGAVGLMVVVALTLSVPLYADAVYNRIFHKELREHEGVSRPPYAFMFRYIGGWYGPLDWSDVENVDELMIQQVPGLLSLPRELMIRYFKTDTFQIFPASDAAYVGRRQPLTWISLGFLSDFNNHIKLVEGRMPNDVTAQDQTIEVLVSKTLADQLGLQLDEQYIAFDRRDEKMQVPVIISGIWEPVDTTEQYWFYDPAYLKDVMVTTEATFLQNLSPKLEKEVYLALWYMVFNGDSVRTDDVTGLLGRINYTMTRAGSLLANVKLDESPVDALWRYQQASRLLMIQLLAFSVPILLLVFAFITLVAGLTVSGQRNEIAVLRSRGASAFQVLGISTIEACVLAGLAIAAGTPVAQGVAQLVGQARSFLTFVNDQLLPVVVTPSSMQIGLIAAGVAIVATVFPIWEAARYTIVTYKQERARSLKPPWWQRAWLDVLILIPAAYGTYLLQKQGTIAVSGVVQVSGGDPFSNPLLFLVPVLMMVALTLFLIRLFPFFLRFLSWLFSRLPGTTFLLAARQLSRSPGFYVAPMLLLILTLALATFTSSLAATLDRSLYDQVRYSVGGDMRLVEPGEDTQASSMFSFGTGSGDTSTEEEEENTGPRWLFIPVSDHLKVDGVKDATRVGRYPATANLSSGNLKAEIMGVDRVDYSRIAFWRNDFGSGSLGALMNALGANTDGVLVPYSVLTENALRVGDTIRITVGGVDGAVEMRMTIVGWFTLWPGWFPNKEDANSLFVANLDYLFEQMGSQIPYDVWLKVNDGADPEKIVDGVMKLGVNVVTAEDVRTQVEEEQTRPERQGLFGVLSVGFAAAALLTVLGFFLYAIFSFRRRLIELGVLRAIGLSAPQMAAFLGWELVLLLGTGVGAGTLLGVAASRLYIPYMQVGVTPEATIVPFAVIIAWPEIYRIYALFGALFVVALTVLLGFLLRMKIFQAVKLGETE
ncbi:MAG: ABC transporter permease [Chloroflexi bacterium]|nr:ABC transporter permease [Chloroflexota bacterium]